MTAPDGRARLLGALALSVAVALCDTWPAALAGLALGGWSLALGGLRSRDDWKRLALGLALVNVFFLGLMATVPLSVPGDPLFTVGPLAFTRQGLDLALLMTAKGNGIFLAFRGLVRPLSPPVLGSALARLGVPDKLCLILALTTRYLDLMRAEWARLADSARMRGFTKDSPRAWRTYALMLALLFMRALDRSAAIHQAMLCRGFAGRFPNVGGRAWSGEDTALGLVCLAAATMVLILERT